MAMDHARAGERRTAGAELSRAGRRPLPLALAAVRQPAPRRGRGRRRCHGDPAGLHRAGRPPPRPAAHPPGHHRRLARGHPAGQRRRRQPGPDPGLALARPAGDRQARPRQRLRAGGSAGRPRPGGRPAGRRQGRRGARRRPPRPPGAVAGRPPDRDGAGLAAAATDPVARFLERLDVRREGKSYVITLAYRSTDAAKAAQVANTVAQLYLAGQLERKTAATRAARELLTVQTEAARAQLDEVQQRLHAFRTGAEPVALARPAGSDDEVAEMNRQLVLASADRIAAETRFNQLRTSLTDGHPGALDSGSVLLQNLSALKADVLRREAELSGQFGARHPRVQDLRNEEATLDERIGEAQRAEMRNREGEVEAARAKERTLASSLEALKGRAKRQDEPAHRAELLENEVELRRRSYEGLVERANSLAELDGMHEPDARVISEAVPPTTPIFPRPKLLVSLGGVVGLALGLALLVLLESRDCGFRGRAEVQASLGLPTLALVPELPAGRKATAPQDYVIEKPRSRYAETLREILAAVMLEPCQGQKGR